MRNSRPQPSEAGKYVPQQELSFNTKAGLFGAVLGIALVGATVVTAALNEHPTNTATAINQCAPRSGARVVPAAAIADGLININDTVEVVGVEYVSAGTNGELIVQQKDGVVVVPLVGKHPTFVNESRVCAFGTVGAGRTLNVLNIYPEPQGSHVNPNIVANMDAHKPAIA